MRYTSGLLSQVLRAGEWFLRSGIQDASGGVARYYRADLERNQPVSTEITGYAVSTLVYLHTGTQDPRYLDRAMDAAQFLTRTAWDAASRTMPFEIDPPGLSYFFDCGIIVRGLLAAGRASGAAEFLEIARDLGQSMTRDFPCADGGGFVPIVALPDKQPLPIDPLRWSRSPGCYQLKAAMAWSDLAETTGDAQFRSTYESAMGCALQSWGGFLPGSPERLKVMDRLHAFLYFLEGLLPRAHESRCAAALCGGIRTAAEYLREIAPEFERADVDAQLLRIRVYADWAGAAAMDRSAAERETERLAEFQISDPDPRLDGGFRFARAGGRWSPHVSPVSTAFALQALELWEKWRRGGNPAHRYLLI